MSRANIANNFVFMGTIAAFCAVVWFSVLAPLQEWRSSTLETRSKIIGEINQLERRIDTLGLEQAQLSSGHALDVLWRASQTGQVTARIQSDLSQLATARGINLRSISPVRSRDMNLAQATGFQIEMEAAMDQLSAFLRDIEYHSPALLIERASLRRLNKRNTNQPQPLVFAQIEVVAPVVLEEPPNQ